MNDTDVSRTELSLIYITGDANVAEFVTANGADLVMVDLETMGKHERQKGRNTWISNHTVADVEEVVSTIGSESVIVRTDPPSDGLGKQVADCKAVGASVFMLPMYSSARQVRDYLKVVGQNSQVIPLAETTGSIECFEDVCSLPEVQRIHVGLNDLQISSGGHFLFEPLETGLLDHLSSVALASGTAFGFGGIARLSEGVIPAELILAEHVRIKSSAVILSRTFRLGDGGDDEEARNTTFATAVSELRRLEMRYRTLDDFALQQKSRETKLAIRDEVLRRRKEGATVAPVN